ncbi:TetR/AcrR family transcriptional regulator [Actinomycetospora straminea]|uniref:TetR/AcrR family transcriptional regulator n=1 Tax=Actinomycetospora straminea TaxID=663607 RepID=A0ABP9EFY8_9PSEU|nr:TetR family transcriptional regulator [Actinomycetospora straminea]MDD7933319.1 TetR family transcriptional regulator [Actinomycetospora straminea]
MTGESLRLEFRRQVRERVLTTAHQHTVERGWERVRVGEVAVDSGVSRPTLYREFGNKDGLGEALMNREAERFFAAINEALAEHDDVGEAVAAATRLTLEEAARNPLLRAVLTGSRTGDVGLLPFLTSRSESIRESARALLATWLEQRRPDLLPTRIEETVDAVVRLVISHVVAPALDPVDVGQRVSRLLVALIRA